MNAASPTAVSARRRAGQERYETAVLRMVDELPAGESIVFVHSHSALIPMNALIGRRRGVDVRARVIVAPREIDEEHYTAPAVMSRRPVFRAPLLAEQRAYTAAVSALLERTAADAIAKAA